VTEPAATAPVPSYRSRSTVRHELKTVERDVRKVEKVVERLRVQLVDAGTDHDALAKVGADFAAREQELNGLEERWLELSTEIEEIDAQ
jgi:predicted  nucleic acid-binding Zn-ribbon protein